MEFMKVARELERLSYHLTYDREYDLFYDTKGRPMVYKEQWNEETELLKELNKKEQDRFLFLLASVCPRTR